MNFYTSERFSVVYRKIFSSKTYPLIIHEFTPKNNKILDQKCVKIGITIKVKICINKCNLYCVKVWNISSVFNDKPLIKNITDTAPYFTVYSGFKTPLKEKQTYTS